MRGFKPGDTVVLSSRIIPGNEKAIYRVIDHLFRRNAHVIYDDGSTPPVHVSGHASQEELKLIINLVKPQYFIPIHGEYRQLKLHAELAASMHGSVGQSVDDRKRRHSGVRRTRRPQGRTRRGGPHLHRFQFHGRCCRGPGNPRSQALERRRHCAAHHRHQQTDRQSRNVAGDRDAWLLAEFNRRRISSTRRGWS